MKRALILAGIVVISGAGIWFSLRSETHAPVSARAMLNYAANTQRQASRVPMKRRLSDEQEIEIGNELARQYRAMLPAPATADERQLEAYVGSVGLRLAARAQRKLPYRFYLVADKHFLNAFALPGGHIFIGSGLISLMQSEDQLAAILGHEIEHVDHYHCMERVQVEAHARKLRLGTLGALASIPVRVFQVGYTKEQEFESDREGTRLMIAAGYAPSGAIGMFRVLEGLRQQYSGPEAERRARSPQGEMAKVAIEGIVGYFRSHPLPAERIAQLETLMVQERWPLDRGETALKVRA